MSEDDEFEPTHEIAFREGERMNVMLRDGVAYTQEEWEADAEAECELVDRRWLRRGIPISGKVRKLRRGR